MNDTLITADDLFGEFQHDPDFVAEQRRLASRTNLAINVNRLRLAKEWTQAALADAAGMKQPRIAEIERGDANPQLDTIIRLAIALGVSDAELLSPATDVKTNELRPSVESPWDTIAVYAIEQVGAPLSTELFGSTIIFHSGSRPANARIVAGRYGGPPSEFLWTEPSQEASDAALRRRGHFRNRLGGERV